MDDSSLDDLRKEMLGLQAELSGTGFILHGTLRKHYMKCGHSGCRCHANPPALHGPYYDWTRRVNGKTRTVRLSEEEAAIVGKWIENMRNVERIVSEMEKISLAALEKIKK